MQNTNYDVIVIGGGPAGSTAAALLAEKGRSVLLCERDKFPRFKIGESLMPGTYWTLKRLGVLDKMKESAYPVKHSVQFYSKTGQPSAPFYFSDNDPHESSRTWQVLRSDFDEMMLENARDKGTEIMQETAVLKVLFEDNRASGVQIKLPDKSVKEVSARVVVDASGQSALLARNLEIKRVEPCLRKASIFTHFRGGKRDDGIDEGATIIFHTRDQDSWFWYIPLPDDVVSVGVVGDLDYLFGNRNSDIKTIFNEELAMCPALKPRLENAEQLFPMKTTQDFSYRAEAMAGNGWVLIGDAFGFLDPIYSSGVFLALKSGELAADAIDEAFQRDDFSAQRLAKFAPEYLRGMEAVRKLIYAFYTKGFSFARFLKEHPHCKRDVVNILIGNVFRVDVNGLFEAMGDVIEPSEEYH